MGSPRLTGRLSDIVSPDSRPAPAYTWNSEGCVPISWFLWHYLLRTRQSLMTPRVTMN